MEIFIAYRRDDSHHITDRIYEWLVREFGKRKVFKDVDSIPLGRDFRHIIRNAVGRCDVLLAVIGDQWISAAKSPGLRRIDDPTDFVRVEIEAALERDVPIIPLLVLDATMPREDDLPPSLKNLAYHNGMPVRPDPDFRHDMERLIGAIRELPSQPRKWPRSPLRLWAVTATVLTALSALILLIATWPQRSWWPFNDMPPRASTKGEVVGVPPNVDKASASQTNVLRPTPIRVAMFPVQSGFTRSVAFSPDGKVLATGNRGTGSGGGVVLWDVAARSRLAEDPLPVSEGDVASVAFSPDGKVLAAGYLGSGGGVVLWDVAARRRLAEDPLLVSEGGVSSVAFSSDRKTLAAGYRGRGSGGGVVLWDVAARSRLAEDPLVVSEGGVLSLAFSPDGKALATGYRGIGSGGGVVLWDVAARWRLAEDPLPVSEGIVASVAFSSDGKALAAGCGSGGRGGVVLWDVAERRRLAEDPLPVSEGDVAGVAFSSDGKALAAGYGSGDRSGVVLWDVAARRRLAEDPLFVNEGFVVSVAFSTDGKALAAGYDNVDRGGSGGGVVLWDVAASAPTASPSP
jgi:WD40 repeat protein